MIPTKQVQIEKWGATKDGNGNAKESIVANYAMWAEPVKLGGSRTDTNGQTKLNNQVQFKIRFRPDWKLSAAWKIIYLGQRYTITNIQRIDEKRYNWIVNGEN